MIARAAAPLAHRSRSRTIARVVPVALALACSAPPGTGEDDDVPEFRGTLGAPGPGAPPTATPGMGAAPGAPPANSNPPATGAGGSSGNEQMGAGAPLTPPSGASAGQTPGAGGSAMVPPAPSPNVGAGGNSMGAGGASMGPVDQDPGNDEPVPPNNPPPAVPPPVNPPPSGDCPGQFFCDGFEGVAAGASPTAALWTIIDGYSERPESANVQVSADNARSGSQALRVANTNSRSGIVAELPQQRYFVRAFLMADAVPLGPVFMGLGTDQGSETRLRIQGQSFATINTVGPGDKVHPDAANSGNCPECVTLTPNNWFCAEMFIDNAAQNATLWIDGVEAASVVNGEPDWPAQPANPKAFLGLMAVQGGSTGVWIDDVVAGPNRIGCD